jgi:hypothetical protein
MSNPNFDKWEVETTQFLRDTMGIPKPVVTPIQLKNQKIVEILQYVSNNTKVDRNYIVTELTKTLLIGQ